MHYTTSRIMIGTAVLATLGVVVGAQGCRASGHSTRQTRTDTVLTEVAEAGAIIDFWDAASERSAPGDRSLRSMAEEVVQIQIARHHLLRDRAIVMYGGSSREIDRFLDSSEADRAALKEKIDGLREVLLARIAHQDAGTQD